MTITPVNDFAVIKPKDAETETASGIILAPTKKEMPQEGEVIAVADNQIVKVGDKVLYGKYAGETVQLKDDQNNITEEYVIVEIKSIRAIIS